MSGTAMIFIVAAVLAVAAGVIYEMTKGDRE